MRGTEQATTGYLLWRVTMRWRAAVERAVAPLRLTHAQYTVLASLAGLGGRPSQRELADFTGLDQVYVSKLVRALERSGYLERTTHPADPRAVQLRLTDSGVATVRRAVPVVRELMESLTEPIGGLAGPENARLRETLRTLLGDPLTEGDLMTQATQVPFGQDLGAAQRAAQRALNTVLDRAGYTFPEWITMKLLDDRGGSLPAVELRAALTANLDLDADAVGALLARLESAGLVRVSDAVELTGTEEFGRLFAAVRELGGRLLDGLPADDVATARRVLVAFTERAARMA